MYYGTETNALNFGVKMSQFKVMLEQHAGTITVQADAYSTQRLVTS